MRQIRKIFVLSLFACLFLTSCGGKNSKDIPSGNVGFFEEQLGLSEQRAKGASYIVEKAGIGNLASYEDKEVQENSYSITLIDEDGNKYYTAFDNQGFIGPIKDESGKYIYVPID